MSVLLNRKWLPITIVGVLSALFYLLMQDYIAVVWYDEICTSDTPINVVLYGKWDSEVWHYTYNPLHAFILIPWLHIFGVSHVTVCNLNIIFSLATFLLLEHWMITKSCITKRTSGFILILLFWMGFILSIHMTKGRIDILGMFLTVILCKTIFNERVSVTHFISLFVTGFLLMLANMYVIPLIAFLSCFLWIVNYRAEGRMLWFTRGFVVACGFVISFVCICYFYYRHNFLIHYLSSFFTFTESHSTSSSFVRILEAYIADPVSLALMILIWISSISNKCKIFYYQFLIFVTAIPLLMCIAGRYQIYYVWLFSVPVLCLFAAAFDTHTVKKLKLVMLMIVVLQSFLRPAYWIYKRPNEYIQRQQIERFVHECTSDIKNNQNIYFVNAICYYTFVEARKKIYYLNNDNLHVNEKINEHLLKSSFFDDYNEYYPCGCLPDEGLAFNTSKEDEDKTKKYFADKGFSYTLLKSKHQMSIYKFEKSRLSPAMRMAMMTTGQ